MRNKKLLIAIKIVFSVFNIPATFYVFHDIFKQVRDNTLLVYFGAIMAILLIDLVFLWLLELLENAALDPKERIPAAVTSVCMALAILAIGYVDEGFLAIAPRISILVIVTHDLLAWYYHYRAAYSSREAKEQQLRDEQVLERRSMMRRAQSEAWQKLYPEFVELQIKRERSTLNIQTEETTLPEYIVEKEDGYGWIHPKTKELVFETVTGNNYTLAGAKNAYARASKNGK